MEEHRDIQREAIILCHYHEAGHKKVSKNFVVLFRPNLSPYSAGELIHKTTDKALLMSSHNICFRREIRKILCGCPLLSVAMSELFG